MEGNCEICDAEIIVQVCCSGYMCGCLGQPLHPLVCEKKECWDVWSSRNPKIK